MEKDVKIMKVFDIIFKTPDRDTSDCFYANDVYRIRFPTIIVENRRAKDYVDEFDGDLSKSLREVQEYFKECGYEDYMFNNTDLEDFADYFVYINATGPKPDISKIKWNDVKYFQTMEVNHLPSVDYFQNKIGWIEQNLRDNSSIPDKLKEIEIQMSNDKIFIN